MTGQEIRDARKAKGWTQKQLADHVAAHEKSVTRWESEGVSGRSEIALRAVLEIREPSVNGAAE